MKTEAVKSIFTVVEEYPGRYYTWYIKPGQNTQIFSNSMFYQSYLLKNTLDETAAIAGWQSIDPESIKQMFNIHSGRKEAYEELKRTFEKHHLNTYINLLLYKYGFDIDRKYINKIDAGQTEPIYPMVFKIDQDGALISVLYHGKDAYELWNLAFSNVLEKEQTTDKVHAEDKEPKKVPKIIRKLNFT